MGKVKIKNNVFIPMPMTIVGSMHEGKPNFMAVGWVTRVNANPPMIAIGIGQSHFTHNCIMENKSFSLNIPDKNLLIQTDYVGLVSGTKVDKSEVFEVHYEQDKNIPLIKEAAVSFECKVIEFVKLPTNTVFIGEITGAYCEEEYLNDKNPDFPKMECFFLTMPDNTYWSLGEDLGKAWAIGNEYKK
jgi:flavin reductase (DIM6/NTAB) family NADH-FMN oxidoreductase RutF